MAGTRRGVVCLVACFFVVVVVVVVVAVVVVVVVVVVVLEASFTHVSVHTRKIRTGLDWPLIVHDWWPDTWEKLPASAPPPEPSSSHTCELEGRKTAG